MPPTVIIPLIPPSPSEIQPSFLTTMPKFPPSFRTCPVLSGNDPSFRIPDSSVIITNIDQLEHVEHLNHHQFMLNVNQRRVHLRRRDHPEWARDHDSPLQSMRSVDHQSWPHLPTVSSLLGESLVKTCRSLLTQTWPRSHYANLIPVSLNST